MNEDIAGRLDEVARILAEQGANRFRVQAYHQAAETLRGLWSYAVPVHVVMAWSGFHEVVEGIVAHIVSPELGAAFNGIQGDIWDAQKDMSLAMTGAVISMLITAKLQKRTPLLSGSCAQGSSETPTRHRANTKKELVIEAAIER